MAILAEHVEQVRRLTEAALAFRDSFAWATLRESQIFVVRAPGTGRAWYVSVRGALGGPPGLGVHHGAEGRDSVHRLRWQPLPTLDVLAALEVSGTFLEFKPWARFTADQRFPMECIGAHFRDSDLAPTYLTYRPGHVPGSPSMEELDALTWGLEQALVLLPHVADGTLTLASADGLWFERRRTGPGPECEWETVRSLIEERPMPYLGPPFVPDELLASRLGRLPRRPHDVWEVDLVALGEALELAPDERWPGIVRLTVVDRGSGVLVHHQPFEATQCYDRAGGVFAEMMLRIGQRPAQLRVRDRRLRPRLALLARALECKLILMTYLYATDDALEDLRARIPPGSLLRRTH